MTENDLKGLKLKEATINDIHEYFKNGELTCRELVEFYIDRIEKYDKKGPSLNTIIKLNPKALEKADELDQKFAEDGFVGPLHGIPVLLKDNVDTHDMETTAGSLSLENVIPEDDAYITEKFREAGAIILAKTNLHEFAIWGETVSSVLGQTLNPYDLTRTPGGSSGGTGSGIAANFGMVGIGTDTINSIRSPASACSLVGFRPTVGMVSRDGIVPYSFTQDTAGPITRTVEDAVKVLKIISGYDKKDPKTAWSVNNIPDNLESYFKKDGLKNKKIGILWSFLGNDEIHKEVNKAFENSVTVMKNNGAEIVDIKEEIDSDKLISEVSVHLHDLKAHLNSYLEDLGDRSEVNSLSEILESGKYHPGIEENIKKALKLDVGTPEYNERLIKRLELRDNVMNIMAEYDLDAIIYPHQKRPVVPVGGSQVERNGVIGSVTGFPACVVPGGFTEPTETAPVGVPIGLEILAREWDEANLIEIAYSFEQASKFRKQPELS
ncbi:MAG: amidase family protein [Bacillota bacterium]